MIFRVDTLDVQFMGSWQTRGMPSCSAPNPVAGIPKVDKVFKADTEPLH
jgi:hypothetical protein